MPPKRLQQQPPSQRKHQEQRHVRSNVSIGELRGLSDPIDSLTPRSFEACTRLGIDPQKLQTPDLSDFLGQKVDKDVAQKRLEHAIRVRAECIDAVERERGRAMAAGAGRPGLRTAKSEGALGKSLASAGIGESNSSSFFEVEKKRLAKIEYLSQKEMERVVEAERKRAEILARNSEREKKELLAREAREAERKRRVEEAVQKQARITLEKKQKADRDLEYQREIDAKLRAAERRQLEIREQEEENRRQEAARHRADQIAADRARQEDLRAREAERQAASQRKLEQMQEAEAVVQEHLRQAQETRQKALQERRAAAEARIARAVAESKALQEEKQATFARKKQEAETRARQLNEEKRKKALEEAKARAADAALKRERKDQVMRAEEERIKSIIESGNDGERVMAANRARAEKERQLRVVERELKFEDKQDMCRRMLKAEEFRRDQVRHARAPQIAPPPAPPSTHDLRPGAPDCTEDPRGRRAGGAPQAGARGAHPAAQGQRKGTAYAQARSRRQAHAGVPPPPGTVGPALLLTARPLHCTTHADANHQPILPRGAADGGQRERAAERDPQIVTQRRARR